MRKPFAASLILLQLLSALSCTPRLTDCSKENVYCVGLVTARGGINDAGLNQSTWEALSRNQSEGIIDRTEYIESIDSRDWDKNATFFAEMGFDVIVLAGYELSEVTYATAEEYPEVDFIGVDQQSEEALPNLITISFPEDQSGFLAGALAVMVTESGKIGAVCEKKDIEPVFEYCEGFRAGATYVDEDIRVLVEYRVGGNREEFFNDPEWGRETALNLIEADVDVIFAYGGGTAEGAFLEAAHHDIPVIGAELDMAAFNVDLQHSLLTNLYKDPAVPLSTLLLLMSTGMAPAGAYVGDIHHSALNHLQVENSNDIEVKLISIRQALINGEIHIDSSYSK